jgi:dynein heavy chain 1
MLKGLETQWKNDLVVEKYAKELRESVCEFEDVVNEVIEKTDQVDEFIEELQLSDLDQEILAQKIDKIQKIIDEFDTKSYSNLQQWVNELDSNISKILTSRLEKRIQAWVKEFTQAMDDEERELVSQFTMKIKMRNDSFILDPPMAQARAYFFTQLHKEVEVICGLRRIEAFRYTKYKGYTGKRDQTYRGLLKQMKNFSMAEAYEAIGKTVDEAESYFKLWTQYKSLWDLQSTQIYDMLGDNVDKWTQLLNEIRAGRKTFDGSEDKKTYGAIQIFYGAVKQDVTNKYDLWHREILKRFGNQVSVAMRTLKKEIHEARSKLEGLSIDA